MESPRAMILTVDWRSARSMGTAAPTVAKDSTRAITELNVMRIAKDLR